MGNSTSIKTAIAVAPTSMRRFRILYLTVAPMTTRLTAKMRIFQILLPMGRINSRANMQILVVKMKDELEKIKEQVLNIL